MATAQGTDASAVDTTDPTKASQSDSTRSIKVIVPGVDTFYFHPSSTPEQIRDYIEKDVLPNKADYIKARDDRDMSDAYKALPLHDKLLIGAGKGLEDMGLGIKQLAAQVGSKLGLVPPEKLKALIATARKHEEMYQEMTPGSKAAGTGRVLGTIAGYAGMKVPAGITGAIIGGAEGGALQPTTEESQSRLNNVGLGMLTGLGFHSALSSANKSLNALKGEYTDPATGDLLRLADEHGVNMSYGDVVQKPLVRKTEIALENLPIVGTSKFREQGSTQVTDATNKVAANLKHEMLTTPYAGLEDLKKVANGTVQTGGLKDAFAESHPIVAYRGLMTAPKKGYKGGEFGEEFYTTDPKIAEHYSNGAVIDAEGLGRA